MYLWDTQALAIELKQDTLNQRERLKYIFLIVFLFSVGMYLYLGNLFNESGINIDGTLVTATDLTIIALYQLIYITTVYLCYRANRNGDNQDFTSRFISLQIPLTMKAIAITYAFLPLTLFLVAWMPNPPSYIPSDYVGWVSVRFGIFIILYFCWRLLYWFRWIAHETAPQEQQ